MKTAKKEQRVTEQTKTVAVPKVQIELGVVETEEFLAVVNPIRFTPRLGVTEDWVGDAAQVTTGKQEKVAVTLKTGMGSYTVTSLSDGEGNILEYHLVRV